MQGRTARKDVGDWGGAGSAPQVGFDNLSASHMLLPVGGWAVPPCVCVYKDVLLDLATAAVLLHIGKQQLHIGQAFANFPNH